MAKQIGQLLLTGTIGGLTYYRSHDGFIVKGKSAVTAEVISTHPKFKRTRENNSEFARAGKAMKVLKDSFLTLLKNVSDNRMTGRLTQVMMKIIQSDMINERGSRTVQDGDLSILGGFNFNIRADFDYIFKAGKEIIIDRVNGVAQINIHSFNPQIMMNAPVGATHFKLLYGVAGIDFQHERFQTNSITSDIQDLSDAVISPIILTTDFDRSFSLPVFLVLGIEFYQVVNNEFYPEKNFSYNAMKIVKVVMS